MSILNSGLAVLTGYLLGSIPSAYLIGRLKGYNLLKNGDGCLGTSLAFRKLGIFGGLTVGLIDYGKGILSLVIAFTLDVPLPVVLLAGLTAVVGHNWSIFLRFRGGRGSMTGYGVLAVLMPWEFIIAMVLAGIVLYFTRRPTLSTIVLLSILPAILWLQSFLHILPEPSWEREISFLLVIFPPVILIPIFLKFVQVRIDKPIL